MQVLISILNYSNVRSHAKSLKRKVLSRFAFAQKFV